MYNKKIGKCKLHGPRTWCKLFVTLAVIFTWKRLGKRAKNGPKWRKILSIALHIWKPYVIWLSFIVNICKMIISSSAFFHFFKILIFWVCMGVKGQKTVHNDKTFCLLHSISQETYIIWLWFLVHMCKMTISPANFFIFKNLDFGGF